MEALKLFVTQSIKAFEKDNGQFKNEIQDFISILTRYDEVLTNKASKNALYDLEQVVKRQVEPRVNKLENDIVLQGNSFSQQQAKF